MDDRWLHTVTHARVRALQGDPRAALRILQAVLAERPDDPDALALLARLPSGEAPPAEPRDAAAPERVPADAAELRGRFRRALGGESPPGRARERLEHWLRVVTRARDAR